MRLLLETLLVGVVGLALSLAANSVSGRGLKLTHNYAPRLVLPGPAEGTDASATSEQATQAPSPPARQTELDRVIAHLRSLNLNVATHEEVVELFHDPLYATAYVFLDARDEANYADGHIPGAYLFNHYYIDRYLGEVLPVVQQALRIVVYCNGGRCEDSEFAAIELLNRGVDPSRLSIYAGGIRQWRLHRLPLEHGARNSGNIRPAEPRPEDAYE